MHVEGRGQREMGAKRRLLPRWRTQSWGPQQWRPQGRPPANTSSDKHVTPADQTTSKSQQTERSRDQCLQSSTKRWLFHTNLGHTNNTADSKHREHNNKNHSRLFPDTSAFNIGGQTWQKPQ